MFQIKKNGFLYFLSFSLRFQRFSNLLFSCQIKTISSLNLADNVFFFERFCHDRSGERHISDHFCWKLSTNRSSSLKNKNGVFFILIRKYFVSFRICKHFYNFGHIFIFFSLQWSGSSNEWIYVHWLFSWLVLYFKKIGYLFIWSIVKENESSFLHTSHLLSPPIADIHNTFPISASVQTISFDDDNLLHESHIIENLQLRHSSSNPIGNHGPDLKKTVLNILEPKLKSWMVFENHTLRILKDILMRLTKCEHQQHVPAKIGEASIIIPQSKVNQNTSFLCTLHCSITPLLFVCDLASIKGWIINC